MGHPTFVRGGELKYLTFMLADQLCGIELSSVRELLGYMNYAPNAAEHPALVGTFDLRGRTVRVMDLRVRFGLPVTRTDDTVMIVVEFSGESVAMIVDNVLGLENPQAIGPIQSNPVSRIDPRFVVGVAKVGDNSMLVLDVARTLVIAPPLPKAA
jgi:purine-binding chemotaxis protein CheW